jgi:hypothetical integral membrane protein (TIGR02206 family)
MQTFRPFTLTHAAMIVGFVALVALLLIVRRRARDDGPRARRIDRTLAAAASAAYVVANTWPLLPNHFDWAWSLPIHVCDLAMLTVPFVLATGYRPARALLYFWGFGLCTQGFFTPDLLDGPVRVGFWMFWLAHYTVVGGAIYDVARGFRPTWKDSRLAIFTGLVYMGLVLPLDILLGVNYGYVGPSRPGQPTIVDALGPWPWRVPVIIILGMLATAATMLPWEVMRRRHRNSVVSMPTR